MIYGPRDEREWAKRGQPVFRETPLSDGWGHNVYWGFDGFACLALELDRLINAPWRKLIQPPWRDEGG